MIETMIYTPIIKCIPRVKQNYYLKEKNFFYILNLIEIPFLSQRYKIHHYI